MSFVLLLVLAALLGYLAGSLPTGVLVARRHGIDLRTIGSGNIGATNVGRALGRRWAIFVLLIDASKGALPVFLMHLIPSSLEGHWAAALAGVGAVCGHVFNIFLRGQGGKGVATALGAAFILAPLSACGALALYLALYVPTRISSLGSLAGVAGFPILLLLLHEAHPATLGFAATTVVIIVVRHRDNLRRLVRGSELRG